MEQRWYAADGKTLHRDNGLPAIIRMNGSKEWWVNGRRHRDNGLPAIEWANGSKSWYVSGELQPPMEQPSLNDKVIEIDGIKYKLCRV